MCPECPPPLQQQAQVLRSLQGDVIPVLEGVGQLPSGHMFLATSLVRGTALQHLPGAGIKARVRTAARAAVARLHSLGVVHGDLTLDNMIWVRTKKEAASNEAGSASVAPAVWVRPSSPGLEAGNLSAAEREVPEEGIDVAGQGAQEVGMDMKMGVNKAMNIGIT